MRAIRGISDAYHPFDLVTGEPRQNKHVGTLIEKYFSDMGQIAQDASLSEKAVQHIDKAHRLVPSMLETISFFWIMVTVYLKNMSLSQEIEQFMRQNLIPAHYLRFAARKAKTAEQKRTMLAVSDQLLARLHAPDSPFFTLDGDQVQRLEQIAKECAGFFQRSSSCVEGRNGQLSLRHHNQHKISPRKLQALTVVHNFFIKRSDETTAAERFFGAKPRDLFDYLLDRIDLPARPAKHRHRPQTKTLALVA
ncbi:MAG: DUF6399 domain-containing protein [Magnetococcus sp. DMHC-1]